MFRCERVWKELTGEGGAVRLGCGHVGRRATRVEGEDDAPGVLCTRGGMDRGGRGGAREHDDVGRSSPKQRRERGRTWLPEQRSPSSSALLLALELDGGGEDWENGEERWWTRRPPQLLLK